MSLERRLEMRVLRRDGRTLLVSPTVGLFTCTRFPGEVLVAGQAAGAIESLGVSSTLVVPPGVSGRIVSPPPQRVHEPVGWGSELFELAPIAPVGGPGDAALGTESAPAAAGNLTVRAPYSGRFWQRASPSDPPYLAPGDVISAGARLGLIEVMKTFTHLHYEPGTRLPARARAVRWLVNDGDEIASEQPLLAIESLEADRP